MADKKISELTELTTPDGTEELVVNDSGVSKKVQIDNLIADNGLSGDKIDGGTISNFTSTGIDDNATSTAITIDASENVGIGTTSPSGLLNIQGTTDHLKLTYPSIASYILDVKSNGDFAIDKDGTERLRIQSGGGISFNGDTAAANALDDYETGTWTPTATNGVAMGATYIKVGAVVTAFFRIRASGGSFSSVAGLPFATLASVDSENTLLGHAQGSDTTVYAYAASTSTMTCSASIADGQTLMGHFTYRAA